MALYDKYDYLQADVRTDDEKKFEEEVYPKGSEKIEDVYKIAQAQDKGGTVKTLDKARVHELPDKRKITLGVGTLERRDKEGRLHARAGESFRRFPSVVTPEGVEYFYAEGNLHALDCPAVIYPIGFKSKHDELLTTAGPLEEGIHALHAPIAKPSTPYVQEAAGYLDAKAGNGAWPLHWDEWWYENVLSCIDFPAQVENVLDDEGRLIGFVENWYYKGQRHCAFLPSIFDTVTGHETWLIEDKKHRQPEDGIYYPAILHPVHKYRIHAPSKKRSGWVQTQDGRAYHGDIVTADNFKNGYWDMVQLNLAGKLVQEVDYHALEEYYSHDKLDRLDGPARVVRKSATEVEEEFYIAGERLTPEEFGLKSLERLNNSDAA